MKNKKIILALILTGLMMPLTNSSAMRNNYNQNYSRNIDVDKNNKNINDILLDLTDEAYDTKEKLSNNIIFSKKVKNEIEKLINKTIEELEETYKTSKLYNDETKILKKTGNADGFERFREGLIRIKMEIEKMQDRYGYQPQIIGKIDNLKFIIETIGTSGQLSDFIKRNEEEIKNCHENMCNFGINNFSSCIKDVKMAIDVFGKEIDQCDEAIKNLIKHSPNHINTKTEKLGNRLKSFYKDNIEILKIKLNQLEEIVAYFKNNNMNMINYNMNMMNNNNMNSFSNMNMMNNYMSKSMNFNMNNMNNFNMNNMNMMNNYMNNFNNNMYNNFSNNMYNNFNNNNMYNNFNNNFNNNNFNNNYRTMIHTTPNQNIMNNNMNNFNNFNTVKNNQTFSYSNNINNNFTNDTNIKNVDLANSLYLYTDTKQYEKELFDLNLFKDFDQRSNYVQNRKYMKSNMYTKPEVDYPISKNEMDTLGMIFEPIDPMHCEDAEDVKVPIESAIIKIREKFKDWATKGAYFPIVEITNPIFLETMNKYKWSLYESMVKLYQYTQVLRFCQKINARKYYPLYECVRPQYSLEKRLGIDELTHEQTNDINYMLNYMQQLPNSKMITEDERKVLKEIRDSILNDQNNRPPHDDIMINIENKFYNNMNNNNNNMNNNMNNNFNNMNNNFNNMNNNFNNMNNNMNMVNNFNMQKPNGIILR